MRKSNFDGNNVRSNLKLILKSNLFIAVMFFTVASVKAQGPTSLQYPTPNGFIANVTSVYLAPTLAGSPTGLSYSISPALPAGLSFNTATGVISGVPTVTSTSATYVVTATNSQGNTTASLVIGVTNTFFDNAYDSVYFILADTLQKVGNGTTAGSVIVYENVRIINGQSIDCIVKTRSVSIGTTFSSYDQPLVTDNTTFNSNNPRFFSPQLSFPTDGGTVVFDFQFIAHDTYDPLTQSGTVVTLQNVKLNTYDIDGNNTALSNQVNEFAGFDTSEVSSASTIKAAIYMTLLPGLPNMNLIYQQIT